MGADGFRKIVRKFTRAGFFKCEVLAAAVFSGIFVKLLHALCESVYFVERKGLARLKFRLL